MEKIIRKLVAIDGMFPIKDKYSLPCGQSFAQSLPRAARHCDWNFNGLARFTFSKSVLLPLVLGMLLLQGCGFFTPPVSAPPPQVRKHKIVCSAWGQMGKRYRPGGSSPEKGFDCSGLVWWSYRQNGIQIPRITADQAKTGKKIPHKNARPGDIVVFRTANSQRGLHTGIYVGDGQFIHSPSSGKNVCLENLHTGYWRDRLLSIRRVTP